MSYFDQLEVVGRGSDTQRRVSKPFTKITSTQLIIAYKGLV